MKIKPEYNEVISDLITGSNFIESETSKTSLYGDDTNSATSERHLALKFELILETTPNTKQNAERKFMTDLYDLINYYNLNILKIVTQIIDNVDNNETLISNKSDDSDRIGQFDQKIEIDKLLQQQDYKLINIDNILHTLSNIIPNSLDLNDESNPDVSSILKFFREKGFTLISSDKLSHKTDCTDKIIDETGRQLQHPAPFNLDHAPILWADARKYWGAEQEAGRIPEDEKLNPPNFIKRVYGPLGILKADGTGLTLNWFRDKNHDPGLYRAIFNYRAGMRAAKQRDPAADIEKWPEDCPLPTKSEALSTATPLTWGDVSPPQEVRDWWAARAAYDRSKKKHNERS